MELMKLSKRKRVVGCKWNYTMKFWVDGTLERYKARLVIKVFTQFYEIDYFEKFILIPKLNTIRILITLVAHLN